MCYSPGAFGPGTIAAAGLNGRVRDGNGCFPRAVITSRKWFFWGNRGCRRPDWMRGCFGVSFCRGDVVQDGVWWIFLPGGLSFEPAGKMVVKPHGGLVRVG